MGGVKMKILVAEDNPIHLDDAIRGFRNASIEVLTAADARSGLEKLEELSPDGVITDIYMPIEKGHFRCGNDNEPCGVAIALRAEQLGIPFIFCTAGHHHGARYQWITDVAVDRGWRMVDSSIFGGNADSQESGEKDWVEAIRQLKELIESKKEPDVRDIPRSA